LLRGGHLARYTICYITEARHLPDRDYLTQEESGLIKKWGESIRIASRDHGGRFVLSPAAKNYLDEYRQVISQDFVEAVNSGEPDGGAIVRLVGQAKTYSLLLHLASEKRGSEIISLETIKQACGLAGYYFNRHHQRFMDYLEQGEEQARKKNISERIFEYLQKPGNDGQKSIRDIYRTLHLKKEVTVQILKLLEKEKMIKITGDNHVVCI